MAGDSSVLRHDLGGSAAHVVVGTGYGEAGSHLAEQHGAVLGVIGDIPDTRADLDAGLVAVVIVGGCEDIVRLVLDGGVLVELVSVCFLVACHARAACSGGATARS